MGLQSLQWTQVVAFLTEFMSTPIVAGALAAIVALAIAGFALQVVIKALTKQ